MFNLRKRNKPSVAVKGIGNSISNVLLPIKYEVRVPDGNWSAYFGKYENQKWGEWDSDSCWCLSAINSVEDQLEWLWKNGMFGSDAKSFFQSNGYIDSDGDFSLSERFHEILCGNRDQGGTSEEAWQSFMDRGFIPRSRLTYSVEQANMWGAESYFVADYFNQSAVTQAMRDLATQSLNYISVAYKRIGTMWTTPDIDILRAAVKQAPLNYGIPIPLMVSNWNNSTVNYTDGRRSLDHEVEGYAINPNGTYPIFDQYLPNLKTLSSNYLIGSCVQGIVNSKVPASLNPVSQPTGEENDTFWTWVEGFFNGFKDSPVNIG